jgi:hypothetical protein
MRRIGLLGKVVLVVLLAVGTSANTFAQKEEKKAKTEKNIERPGIVGHAATDKFVDSSFDVYERNIKLTDKLSNAAGNAGEVKTIKKELENQTNEVKGLLEQSADVMKEAKTISPKTNSIKAVKAINSATKALNTTKENFPIQLEQIKNQESN